MRRVVLGVSGSVAAYRACDLARDLMRAGCEVRVCLTDAAAQFVAPALFEALTGKPCLQSVFEEPERGRMAHIDWARWAELVLVAPATANTLAKLAAGQGDDMLTTIALATNAPLALAPAMNPAMYTHPGTQDALRTLAARGAHIVEPSAGEVACGENGQGKLASNPQILAAALALLDQAQTFADKTILITSGPTREPIDDARFLTNRSSGKMGLALARAAKLLGAKVVLVTGPTGLPDPPDCQVVHVETAQEMLQAVLHNAPDAHLLVGAAAVADYRPARRAPGKIRRTPEDLHLHLVPNPDIVATAAESFPHLKVVAFAAEPTTGLDYATEKIKRKKVAAIAVNDVSRQDIGFGADDNELTLVTAKGHQATSGKRSKLNCALWLLQELAKLP